MKGVRDLKFSIGRFHDWLGGREETLRPAIDLSRPSVRAMVALALLDAKNMAVTYAELAEAIKRKRVLLGDSATVLSVLTLRVAISEIGRELRKKKHSYKLIAEKRGKLACFRLEGQTGGEKKALQGGSFPLVVGITSATMRTEEISRALLRDGGGLPFASFYCNYRTAAQWLCYSAQLGRTKREYEADAFAKYNLLSYFGTPENEVLGVVGLAPGEGLGEIELLSRLMREAAPANRIVHYLAVDTSEFLLASHSFLVREKFRQEIADGRLKFVPILGDLFQLPLQLKVAREHSEASFLTNMPITVTYLGNCLGNHEAHEWDFFKIVMAAFPKPIPLAIMVGVSIVRHDLCALGGDTVDDSYYMDAFTLETPRTLLYDGRLLQSLDDQGQPISPERNEEFLVPSENDKCFGKKIKSEEYSTPLGVKGRVYRFLYRLRHNIRTSDGEYFLAKGSKVLLYSIIKYDLESLVTFLVERGLTVKSPENDYFILKQMNGPEEYRYGVIAAVRSQS